MHLKLTTDKKDRHRYRGKICVYLCKSVVKNLSSQRWPWFVSHEPQSIPTLKSNSVCEDTDQGRRPKQLISFRRGSCPHEPQLRLNLFLIRVTKYFLQQGGAS